MKEKQFNFVSLWHCLFSQWAGDLGLLELICLSTDHDCCWDLRCLIFDSSFLLLPSQLRKEALAFPIVPEWDRNPFHPRNCYVLVTKPDFTVTTSSSNFQWERVVQVSKGYERALSKIQQAPESPPSRGLESEAVFPLAYKHSLLAPSEATEPKTFHWAAWSSACQQNPMSPRRNHRVGLQYSFSDRAAKTANARQVRFSGPHQPSPLSQTGKVIWESECDR